MGHVKRAGLTVVMAVLALALAASWASADTISIAMSMTISANANPDSFTVTVHLENKGNTAAKDVTALLSIMDLRLASRHIETLPPGKPVTITYAHKLDEMPKGSFPAVLLVDYHDESGYAFSALHCAAFNTSPEIKTDLPVKTQPAEISKEGTLSLSMENTGDRARDFRVRLILPREFKCGDRDRVFLLDSHEQKKLSFNLENRTALTGATYPASFIVEYDEDYVHHTVVADAMMTVVSKAAWFGKARVLLWIFLGLCLLGAIVAVIWPKIRGASRR